MGPSVLSVCVTPKTEREYTARKQTHTLNTEGLMRAQCIHIIIRGLNKVEVVDARRYAPFGIGPERLTAWLQRMEGVPGGIRFIADAVRLAFILADGGGGVACDLDTIHLRRWPSMGADYHFVATMRYTRRMCSAGERHVKGLKDYLSLPLDSKDCTFPMGFCRGSPVLEEVVPWLLSELDSGGFPRTMQNPVMKKIQRVVRVCGLDGCFAPPSLCSPFNPAKPSSYVLKKENKDLFDEQAVLASHCINNYWQTSKDPPRRPSLLDPLKPYTRRYDRAG